eukprot:c11496_g1_i4.p1 GENE.c11496_g1_i4~~c11496_g1_i4.p1  ORF type:complete len:269 (+),score=60.87 c11496_g1_i4:435-1241(+)
MCNDQVAQKLRITEFKQHLQDLPGSIPPAVMAYQNFAACREGLLHAFPLLEKAICELHINVAGLRDNYQGRDDVLAGSLRQIVFDFGAKEEKECADLLELMWANHTKNKNMNGATQGPITITADAGRAELTNKRLLLSMASAIQDYTIKLKALQAERKMLVVELRAATPPQTNPFAKGAPPPPVPPRNDMRHPDPSPPPAPPRPSRVVQPPILPVRNVARQNQQRDCGDGLGTMLGDGDDQGDGDDSGFDLLTGPPARKSFLGDTQFL